MKSRKLTQILRRKCCYFPSAWAGHVKQSNASFRANRKSLSRNIASSRGLIILVTSALLCNKSTISTQRNILNCPKEEKLDLMVLQIVVWP